MSQYERIVSYLYQYESGVKKENSGYARIEQREKECRIHLQVRLPFPVKYAKAYFYIQQTTGIQTVEIGEMQVGRNEMRFKIKTDRDDLFASGKSFDQMDGILIFVDRSVCFATTWKQDYFFLGDWKPENVVARPDESAIKTIEADVEGTEREIVVENKEIREEVVEHRETPQEEMRKEAAEHREMPQEETRGKVAEHREMPQEETREKVVEHRETPREETREKVVEHREIPQEETREKAAEHRETQQEDVREKAAEPLETVILDENEKTGSRRETAEEGNIERNQETVEKGIPEKTIENRNMERVETVEQKVGGEEERSHRKTDKKEAEDYGTRILMTFPAMHPFHDMEGGNCVKMDLEDIGCLPMRFWSLSGNRFLLHGYYCYRHLLFLRNRKGDYVLGVPGIYNEKECRNSMKYGFPFFQPIGEETRQGAFGYWMMDLE